jgi:uncharacterized protein
MPNYEDDIEYMNLVFDILKNEDVQKMSDIQHHRDTRLNHSIKVSYHAYKIARHLKLDYKAVARAGLLHDFYFEQVNDQDKLKDKVYLLLDKHPQDAVKNSLKYFDLNDMEKDIIRSHMFPFDIKIPKYSESWVVSMVDKAVSVKETYYRFNHEFGILTNLYLIVMLKIMK